VNRSINKRQLTAILLFLSAIHCFGQRNVKMSVSPSSVILQGSETQQFAVSVRGSSKPVVWSFSPAAGTISSTGLYTAPASIPGQLTVTVMATSGADASQAANATVTLLPQLAITTAQLPSGTTGVPYYVTVTATGGIAPYTWSLRSGVLPAGLGMSTSSGSISGTPTKAGSYNFAVQVSDKAGNKASQFYTMAVIAAPTPIPSITWGPTYYVSGQYGNDTWSGLLPSPNASNSDGPFQTLAKAQVAMRLSSTVKAVTIRAGIYSIASTLSLDWSDSAELWISYPREIAVLDAGGTGGVTLSGVNHVKFQGLTFQNMGATGLYLSGGSNTISIQWNTFYNCNSSCISGAGVTNTIIDSNIINGQSPGNPTGNSSSAYSAISFWYGSSNNQITHNLIANCQGGGVAFSAGPTDPPNNNNVVDRNILQNVDTNVIDNGAIYMMDRSHSALGNQITDNIVDGNGGTSYLTNWTKAIYLDDLMSNVLISGNICRNCGEYGLQIHGGDHNTIVNNIFDLSSAGTLIGLYQNNALMKDFGMNGNVFERNIIYLSNTPPASLWRVGISSSDAVPVDSTNLYYSASGASIADSGTILDASPFYANPEFTNPLARDYSMPSSSLVYGLIQFQPLPTDQGPLPYAP
jgi:hypothetical protein